MFYVDIYSSANTSSPNLRLINPRVGLLFLLIFASFCCFHRNFIFILFLKSAGYQWRISLDDLSEMKKNLVRTAIPKIWYQHLARAQQTLNCKPNFLRVYLFHDIIITRCMASRLLFLHRTLLTSEWQMCAWRKAVRYNSPLNTPFIQLTNGTEH
jgi:hypothetical protein